MSDPASSEKPAISGVETRSEGACPLSSTAHALRAQPVLTEYANPKTECPATDAWSIASLVCGVMLCVPFVPGILAIVFGIIGSNRTSEPGVRGRGFAHAGLVLGTINLLPIPWSRWIQQFISALLG